MKLLDSLDDQPIDIPSYNRNSNTSTNYIESRRYSIALDPEHAYQNNSNFAEIKMSSRYHLKNSTTS